MRTDESEEYAVPAVKLRLKCGACGHIASYKVGHVFIGGSIKDDMSDMMKHLSFSGYFRCRKCNSSWPWELAGDSQLRILGFLMNKAVNQESEEISFVIPVLFDHTPARSAAQAEDHLLEILRR